MNIGMATLVCVLVASSGAAVAADKPVPEYMELKPRVGLGLEVSGELNSAGLFVADDMMPLKEARKPKLRAPIEAIDREQGTIRVLGMTIRVKDDTTFDAGSFQSLKVGQQIEVKCSVRDDGWKASSIQTLNVKPSVKVKVTITSLSCDGVAPDTLDASGFKILLTDDTDAEEASRTPSSRERRLFRELAHDDAGSLAHGVPFAGNRGFFAAEYRHKYETESESDLSPSFDSDTEDTEPQLRVAAIAYPTRRIRAMAQLRVRQEFVLDAPAGEGSGDIEADFLQLSILARDIAGAPLALQVGRQRYKEPREWLYDDYLDAARVSVYPWRRFSAEASVIDGRNSFKEKFRSWTDAVALVTAGAGDGLASAYVWQRWDSDEARNREPLWAGLRYRGNVLPWLKGWGDGAIMRGEDKQRTLDAWAFDVGAVAAPANARWRPSVSMGYAAGSGNPPTDDGRDHRFRQSGYEDNTAAMNGVGLVHYYGALLDPELSNITVFSAGAGFRPLANASIEALYCRYRQYYPADESRSALVDPPARPNGVDPELGEGIDVIVGLSDLWGHVTAAWTLAWFLPGAAFAPRNETAFLNRLEIRLQL